LFENKEGVSLLQVKALFDAKKRPLHVKERLLLNGHNEPHWLP